MTLQEKEFEIRVNATLEKLKLLLVEKGKEYRRNNNPYHNFEKGAQMTGLIPEKVLQGFLLKHLVSVDDMINDLEVGVLPKESQVEEKFNDILVYFLIQKCQILNRL